MPESLIGALSILGMAALVGWLYWGGRRDRAPGGWSWEHYLWLLIILGSIFACVFVGLSALLSL